MVIFGYNRNILMWKICINYRSIDEIINEWVYGPDQQEEYFKNLLLEGDRHGFHIENRFQCLCIHNIAGRKYEQSE